jgi:thiol-disulfide isomerase/thioredoxin
VAFSPDGKRIVSGGGTLDNTVKVWDASSGREILTFRGHSKFVHSVAFSPEGKRIVSASSDGTVKVWDAASGQETLTFKRHSGGAICLAFSPNGARIASGSTDKTVKIWDATSGQETLTLKRHSAPVTSVAFSPNGRQILSADENGDTKVWDAATGQENQPLLEKMGLVESSAFSADGTRIAFGNSDGCIYLVRLPAPPAVQQSGRVASAPSFANPDAHATGSSRGLPGAEPQSKLMRLAIRDRYTVPDGGAAELLEFIGDVKGFTPQTPQEYAEHAKRGAAAIEEASSRILQLETDRTSAAWLAASRVVLEGRVRRFGHGEPTEQRETLKRLMQFLAARAEKRLAPQDIALAGVAEGVLSAGAPDELSREVCRSVAKAIRQNDEKPEKAAEILTAASRSVELFGQEMRIRGSRLDGAPFDSAAYRGKFVLLYFWSTQSPACQLETANVKKLYELYHERGLEVIAVNLDRDKRRLQELLDREPPPWTMLYTRDASGNDPTAIRCGVVDMPVVLLLDKEGKVISLRAQGDDLASLLEKLLGPPYKPKGALSFVDLQPRTNQFCDPKEFGEFTKGRRSFLGVEFQIGEGYIRLKGKTERQFFPTERVLIPIDTTVGTLYILHTATFCQEGIHVPKGTTVGRYLARYEDGSAQSIPIVCGEDVRDWYVHQGDERPVTRGLVAHRWANFWTNINGESLRIYLCAWKNPHPEKKITSIDYVSTNTAAGLFCVAMTIEAPTVATNGRSDK